jgi:hypothetical protein
MNGVGGDTRNPSGPHIVVELVHFLNARHRLLGRTEFENRIFHDIDIFLRLFPREEDLV